MKTLHTIMVLIALASIPAFIGVQQAMAGSTGATGEVTIAGQCELGVGAMIFAGGDPTTDCAACGGTAGVGQLTVVLDNSNGNLRSDTDVSGANWLDSIGPFDAVQSVGSTVKSDTTGTFASKTSLTGTLVPLVIVPVAGTADSFWDVSIDLDLDNTFAGTAEQSILFDFACVV